MKVLEENCPGPLMKKDKTNDRIRTLMDKIRPERGDTRRKPSNLNFAQSKYRLDVLIVEMRLSILFMSPHGFRFDHIFFFIEI